MFRPYMSYRLRHLQAPDQITNYQMSIELQHSQQAECSASIQLVSSLIPTHGSFTRPLHLYWVKSRSIMSMVTWNLLVKSKVCGLPVQTLKLYIFRDLLRQTSQYQTAFSNNPPSYKTIKRVIHRPPPGPPWVRISIKLV
jgi:hypothetical protein